jgi:PAS domain S-box-containing protein
MNSALARFEHPRAQEKRESESASGRADKSAMAKQGDFFQHRGEVAALMRATDWSPTPLGHPSTWPAALHTTIRLMLTSRYAMWMGWGPDLRFFYNDAYREQTLGKKHPWALGRSAHEVWAEIWDQIGSRVEHVLRTGDATWDQGLLLFLERSGYREETYHTFSYSPAMDDDGRIAGLFCVVIEETERVIGERRITILRDLAAAIGATTTTRDVLRALEGCLDREPRIIPFALAYLCDDAAHLAEPGDFARRVALAGIDPAHPRAPESFGLSDPDAPWPVREVLLTRTPVILELDAALAWPRRPWGSAPVRAVVAPIPHQGRDRPAGVLVAGLTPFRPVDEATKSFVDLVVGQLAAGIGSARAREGVEERARSLAALDQAKTAFFSNVSHEFRTPLTLMLAPIEDMRAEPDLGPEERRRVEVLHRNARRLLKLVNTLLDFSRIEAGRAQAVFEPTELAGLTADIASSFRSAIERAGLTLEVDCPPLSEAIFVDRGMWEKIVLNLVSNAFKFTFEGRIEVRVRDDGPWIELSVSDTGTGIAEHHLPRLFERFHRIEGARSRSFEGSGIGLALVHELVRMHGGEIRVESRVGEGTTFHVRVPRGSAHLAPERILAGRGDRDRASAADWRQTGLSAVERPQAPSTVGAHVEEALRWLASPPSTPPPPDHAADESRERILVADDNADMRDYVSRLFGDRWTVEAVPNGRAALEAIGRHRPDLVLTDAMMPEMDGFELLRAIRADQALRSIPVVLVSARAGEEASAEGLDAGADDYIVKPFSARDLLVRVTARLVSAREARRLARAKQDAETLATELAVVTERLLAAQNVAGVGIFDWDLKTGDLFWSPELYHLMGLAPGAVPPTTDAWNRALVAEDRESGWAIFRDAARARRDRTEHDVRLVQPDGSTRWVRVSTRFHYEGAEPVRLVGAAIDVQAIKDAADARVEVELAKTRARDEIARTAAAERAKIFTTLLGGPAAIAVFRGDEAVIELANAAAAAIWGRTHEHLVGRPLLDAMPELHEQGFDDLVRGVMRSGEPVNAKVAHLRVLEDGRLRDKYVNFVYAPLADADGRRDRVLAWGFDVTDLVAQRRVAEAARAEAEAANRMKDEFLATMSHELRTPLNAMLGWAKILKDSRPDAGKLERGLAVIERNAVAQARLVSDLLDVSRIVSGKLSLSVRRMDLAGVILAAVDVVRPAADARGVRLLVDVDENTGAILADPDRVQQIAWNLLVNAVRFTPRSGTVTVRAARVDSIVRVVVEDTGVGIPSEHLPHIFERFRQVDSSTTRTHGGLGLGLAIVRHLVEAHGGDVAAESAGAGQGATFIVTLPIRAVQADGAGDRPSPPAIAERLTPAEERRSLDGVRVLAVDDDEDSLELLRLLLEGAGASFTGVTSAPDALALESIGSCDVIISDIGMPQTDGYAFIRRVRARDGARGAVPAIALTAYARPEDAERAVRAGFQQHLAKPVDADELVEAVRRWTLWARNGATSEVTPAGK